MKKYHLVFVFILLTSSLFAFDNDIPNGTILETGKIQNHEYVIKKHQQTVKVESISIISLPIYEDVISYKPKSALSIGDEMKISQLIIVDNKETFFKITVNDISGYILIDYNNKDFYKNGEWMYEETIKTGNNVYHTKKVIESFTVNVNLRIRDNPGLTSNKIGLIVARTNSPVFIKTMAITDEKDVIDGIEECWAKIEYNGIIGWVFCGYLDYYRPDPRFWTPEYEIWHMFQEW